MREKAGSHVERFSEALERRDLSAMLSSYQDDAELKLASCSATDHSPRVVLGKTDIAFWVSKLLAAHTCIEVVERLGKGAEMTLIIECRRTDGTRLVVACTAVLVDGLISRQFVVLV